jgi:coenzyme F420-reducing hydrogenase beta subunit
MPDVDVAGATMQPGGPAGLHARVLAAGQCTACGACLGHCPYLRALGERVAFIHPCPRTTGRCFEVCPRTALAPAALDRQVFGAPRTDAALGVHRSIHIARALDPGVRRRAQYGGVVTALTRFALESGTVAAALLTGGSPTDFPRAVVARDADAVSAAAGTKYTACPSLAPLARLRRDGAGPLAVVGRPCQVAAVRKVAAREGAGAPAPLVIGLFCFWALSPDFYRLVGSRPELARATKIDVPKEGGVVFSKDGRSSTVPLDEVRPFIRRPCHSCFDPTAEWADVAVGSTEYVPGWNTLVVRSAAGERLVDAAVDAAAIERRRYPSERLPILRQAVLAKKRRVLGEPDRGYLDLGEADRAALAEAPGPR